MTQTQSLLADIEAFLTRHGMPYTTFGLQSCRDAHAVRRLRDGHGLTMRRAEKMRKFMDEYEAKPRLPRPRPRKRRSDECAAA